MLKHKKIRILNKKKPLLLGIVEVLKGIYDAMTFLTISFMIRFFTSDEDSKFSISS